MQSWMDNDREVLARTLIAEAGNQGPLGMLAAGSVIMNRARTPGYGDGVRGVIMKPGQFSPWNSVTGYAGGEQGQDMAAIRPTSEAYSVADRLLSGQYEDPTGGATHFYNPDISTPSWGQSAGGDWTRIGAHVFGRADAGRNGRGGNMQPQGLLGTMSTRSAPEQERLPFFQRPETADLLDRLTVGFGGLTMRPNQALIQSAQESLSDRREDRKTAAQRNATIDLLRRQKRDDLISAVEGGLPITEALKLALTPSEAGYTTLTGAQLNAQYGTSLPEGELFNVSGRGQITKVGGGGVSVTNQLGADADTEFFKQFYGGLGKELASVRTQASQAAANIPVLSSLRELYSVAPTGPISGRVAELFPEANDVSAAIEAARVQLAPQLRVEGSGSTSDVEYAGMLQSLGSMRNSPAANQALLDLMLLKAEVMQAKAAVAAQVRPDGLSPMDAAQQLDEIDRTMWKQSPRLQSINAIISGAGGAAAPAVGATAPANTGSTGGVQWRVVE